MYAILGPFKSMDLEGYDSTMLSGQESQTGPCQSESPENRVLQISLSALPKAGKGQLMSSLHFFQGKITASQCEQFIEQTG